MMLAVLQTPLLVSSAALVAANLVPLGGVLLGLWSSYDIMLLFWAENVVIGLLQLLRMASVLVLRRALAMLVLMPFFTLHYGIFTFVHGTFLAELMGPPRETLGTAVAVLLAPEGLLLALLALAASHALSFALNFLGGGEWREVEERTLMVQPYGRVVLLHLVVIFGGVLAMALGDATVAVALLVVMKVAADLLAHWRQHRAAPISPGRPAPAP
ncbi:DUF6498-containing protein [Falsiroseomonas sp. E2-1-a20]|uniref:DUF6498-containing protein n=1 Tax=Falsiroseomonas sp. E2-1-a20 TaxID=3239300 RepID=UPI003F34FA56